jgi:actin related protein 2/3 complex subunit 2
MKLFGFLAIACRRAVPRLRCTKLVATCDSTVHVSFARTWGGCHNFLTEALDLLLNRASKAIKVCDSYSGPSCHAAPPTKMLLLDYQNVLIQSILTERFSGAPPQSVDQIVSDFDGVTFHISTPSTKSQILISLSIKCYRELLQYGAEGVLQREYGSYITSPEAGYDFSILVDLENLPQSPEEKEELVRRISLLKRNVMAAPFEKAFDQFSQLSEEASHYTSESAPQGIAEGGEVMAIHYREEEAIYIKASHDRVTVIFSTIFRDETDRIFGKVFLQEFVDARRRAIQNAPQVLFRSDPPLELQGMKGVGKTGEKGEVGFITFGTSASNMLAYITDQIQSCSRGTLHRKEESKTFHIFKHSETTSIITSKLRRCVFRAGSAETANQILISMNLRHTSIQECEDVLRTSYKVYHVPPQSLDDCI